VTMPPPPPDPTSDSLDLDEEDLLKTDGDAPPPPEPPPYQFDPADVAVATTVVDAAFAKTLDGFLAASAITEAAASHNLNKDSPLVRELVLAASYPLRLERSGRPGCELGPAAEVGTAPWPPAIRSVKPPVVELWRALAYTVTAPAAVARFEDLLFCRRDGNGFDRATRAAEAYLDAADRGDLDMDAVEAIVRAWTLARSVRQEALEARIREKLAEIAADLLRRRCCVAPTRDMLKERLGPESDRRCQLVERDRYPLFRWRVHSQLVVSAAKVLDERMPHDDGPGATVLLEPSHRSQPRFQPTMVALDAVVGVAVGTMPCRWQQLLQHRRIQPRLIGGDLGGGDLGRANGPLEEPPGGACVPPW
jgi:hypothetical protein